MRVPDFLVFDRNSSPLDQSRVLVPKADRPSLLRRGARTKFQRNSSFTPPSARQQVDRHRQAESMPPGAYIERFDHTALDEGVTLSDGPLVEPPLDFTLPFADSVSSSSSPPPLPPMHQHEQSDFNSSFTSRPMERRASAEELPRLQQHHASSPTPTIEIKQLESGQNRVTQESAPLGHTVHEHSQKQSSHQQQLQQQHQHQRKQQQHLDTASPIRPSSERKSAWSWGFKRSKSEQVRGDHHGDKVHIQAETVPRPRPSVSTEASSNTNNTAMTTPSVTTTPSPPPTNSNGKEKESGKRSFGLSSLFSRKNTSTKGQQASTAASTTATSSTAPMAPKDFQLNRINQNRLPIHIERAIYRLSHSKLANPRRPLHEQVLISNLMFWYLSLVSSHQSQQQQQQQQQAGNGTAPDNKARKFVNAGKKGKRRPPSPSNNSNSPRPPSSQHQQQAGHDRPTSPSNTAESRISYQQQQQKNRSPHNPKHHAQQQQQQQENGNVALHQFMGTSRDSTGFVVPENYLKPQQQGSKGMSGVGRRSSLSDSEDDDDDGDEEEGAMSDSSSDDEPSNNNVTMKARAAAATKHRTSNDLVPNHAHITKQKGDDDVPLAMYRKGKA
ncbi:hypothetical protein BDA99DRAFT_307981 [Phascolomyces articulosus]|uniref:Protein Zds1 C-terminal domain-containing protein n=1 Tax=Phascolomyces articulosus TaxID=60185 RepID=A0AAD5KIR3_9FUNG|nr:hypothetical protein BDA99DRAFT_307981 [Phascolomyces articulosus]